MGFQGFVNNQPAPGVPGDFAAMNPEATILSVPGGLIADSVSPPIVANMGFANINTGIVSGGYSDGDAIGFIHRDNQTLIMPLVDQPANLYIKPGLPVTLFDAGSFWGRFTGPNGAVEGESVYANVMHGALFSSVISQYGPASGVPDPTSFATGFIFQVNSVVSGIFQKGQLIYKPGDPTFPRDVRIVDQVNGTPGGAGIYSLSKSSIPFSNDIVAIQFVLTQYLVDRTVASGEIAPISSWH